MMNTILLSVIAVLLVVVVYMIMKERKRAALDIQELIASEIHELFDQDIREISKAYAEERKLIQWIEELAEKDELDMLQLTDAAQRRAYALAVKKAEDAVTVSEATLASLKREIADEQKALFRNIRNGLNSSVSANKKALKELNAQEEITAERVERERAYLKKFSA